MGFIDSFQRMSIDELRTEVIGLLKQAYSDGRIIVETLERRLKEATTATEKEVLIGLIADIPAQEGSGSTVNHRDRPDRDWMINNRVPRESEGFFAILGGSTRNGRWQPARNITCLSLMGGITLDFREAEFPADGVRINAGCIMGGLDITVPPGINVNLSGLPLLGGMDNKAGDGDGDAPTISVRGVAIMGAIDIKRKELKGKKTEGRGTGRSRNRKSRRKANDRFYEYE